MPEYSTAFAVVYLSNLGDSSAQIVHEKFQIHNRIDAYGRTGAPSPGPPLGDRSAGGADG